MHTVLLVDDEPWTLIGLKKVFNWSKMGFEIIDESTDSQKALQLILRKCPDVVFSDIRMPEMNGIELMKKARKVRPDTEFIFISGFAEFKYAQEALREGAFDYRLKPIDFNVANDILQRLSNYLNDKRCNRDLDTIYKIMENTTDVRFLLNLDVKCKSLPYYQVILLEMKQDTCGQYELNFPENINSTQLQMGKNKIMYIVNTAMDIEQYFRELYKKINYEAKIGISSASKDVNSISTLIQQANIALNSDFISTQSGLFKYYPLNRKEINKIISDISIYIDKGQYDICIRIISRLPDIFIAKSFNLEDVVYLWNQLVAYLTKDKENEIDTVVIKFHNHEQIIDSYKDFSSLCTYLTELINYFYCENKHDKYSASFKFQKLLNYVTTHYNEPIYLREIAEDFYINSTYCCELFKKETGMTFTKYLTSLRIDKSKELLVNNNLTINDIARLVGYNDCYHFNKVFKKIIGIPPGQYRKNM